MIYAHMSNKIEAHDEALYYSPETGYGKRV